MNRLNFKQYQNDFMVKQVIANMVEEQKTTKSELAAFYDIWVKPSHILNYKLSENNKYLHVRLMDDTALSHTAQFEMNDDLRHAILTNL